MTDEDPEAEEKTEEKEPTTETIVVETKQTEPDDVEDDVDFDAEGGEGEGEVKETTEKPKKRVVEITQTGSLHVKGFKRPLQVAAVKEKFESYGELKFFFMNKYKSAAYVTFVDSKCARACRRDLDG